VGNTVEVGIPRDPPVKRNDASEAGASHGPRLFPDDKVVPRVGVYLRFPVTATAADLHGAVERALEPSLVSCQLMVTRRLPDLPGSAFEERVQGGIGGVRVRGGDRGSVVQDDSELNLLRVLGPSHHKVGR